MSVVGYQPPPFFKRGPAPLAKLFVLVSLSLTLLVVDHRFRYLELLRQVVSMVTAPLQLAAARPVESLENAAEYLRTLAGAQMENAALKQHMLQIEGRQLRMDQLEQENARLRALLQMRERQPVDARVGEILFASRDPFSRRVIIDLGLKQGIDDGQPVVDDKGVIGQVTRVYPFYSEVRLVTDKDQAIPVQVVRNGMRAVLFGSGGGQLEIPFLAANADVRVGDEIVTSGLDGIYLPGLPVARVTGVNREGAGGFATITCDPAAGVDRHGSVLILGKRKLPPQIPVSATDPASPSSAGATAPAAPKAGPTPAREH